MISLKKLIPSKSLRQYLMQTGHEFSLCEEAALVYLNPFFRQDERLDDLNEIARFLRLPENSSFQFPTYRNCIDGAPDSCEKITADELAAQIEAHIKSEMEIESALFRNNGIYEVTYFVKKESLLGEPYDSFFAHRIFLYGKCNRVCKIRGRGKSSDF